MSSFFIILIIAISLSMDAFSLSLAYGITKPTKRQRITLSLTVGIYHFIMPLIGLFLGVFIENHIFSHLNLLSSIILIYIGIDLIISNFKEEISLTKPNYLMFGLSVSIDSLMLGVGLKSITSNYLLASSTFCIISGIFTYLGLLLGNIIGNKIGLYSKISGGIILIIIAIVLFIT